MIRVFIADDHQLVREGLAKLLRETPDITVVGEAGDGLAVLDLAPQGGWDVLLLDLMLPKVNGFGVLAELRRRGSKLRVIVLSMYPEGPTALQALSAGAAGFVSKGRSISSVIDAIRQVHRGGRYITPELAELLLDSELRSPGDEPHTQLTRRQFEVLVLLGEGMAQGEIAARLGLSASTVSTHLMHIKLQLGLRTIAELAQYALQKGLVSPR